MNKMTFLSGHSREIARQIYYDIRVPLVLFEDKVKKSQKHAFLSTLISCSHFLIRLWSVLSVNATLADSFAAMPFIAFIRQHASKAHEEEESRSYYKIMKANQLRPKLILLPCSSSCNAGSKWYYYCKLA